MAQNVHYEIFRRQGAGGWSLVEVREKRDDAMAFAGELVKSGTAGVKVVKETFNEATGDYLSLKVFEHGEIKTKIRPKYEDVPSTPCFKVDDLYSYHARKTIALLIPDFLAHHKVTVTELGHRADLLERLEAAGTLLQHAIQRVAVAQAIENEQELPKIIRTLHDLAIQAFHRVYRDAEKGRFASCKPGHFAALAAKLADTSDSCYVLNGVIAGYLKDAKSWDEKVHRLMGLMEETHEETPGTPLLLTVIDTLISEVLAGPAGLKALVGAQDSQGEAVMALVKLFLGREPDKTEGHSGLVALTRQFAADTLPNARVAIAERIVAEIRSFKRLDPSSLEEELKALRQIANLLVMGIGKYLSHEELIAAFVLRSQRLITSESLAPFINGEPPDVKLERILFVEENIIGAENKRQLAAFITPIITGPQFAEHFLTSKLPLLQRLQQLAQLSERVMQSSFQENQKAEIGDVLDRIAASIESRGQLFESIDRRQASPSEKAVTLIKLLSSNTLTSPRLAGRAREMVIGYAGKPGFLAGYVSQNAKDGAPPDRDAAVADLMRLLEKAGITPETGLKTIAA
jgi:hypothetical protein